jgi:hypothetical protein
MAGPSGWFPQWFKKPKKPFMPGLPRHTNTSVLHVSLRRKRWLSRLFWALALRWRYLVTGSAAMGVVVSMLAGTLVLVRDSGQDPNKLPIQGAPTLVELNRSIALGQRYVDALYKQFPDGTAVQSEASGVPLKANFSGVWALLGEDKTVCVGGDCQTTTHISDVSDDETHDYYTVAFSTKSNRDALRVKVEVNWVVNARQFQLQLTPLQVKESASLWLDQVKLVSYSPGDKVTSTHSLATPINRCCECCGSPSATPRKKATCTGGLTG